MTQQIENLFTYCKNHIAEQLHYYEGQKYYACDLGDYLTEEINANGTFTYSRALAMDVLKEWWEDAALYYEYEKMSFGECTHNPFENPEAYTVCMVIEGVRSMLSQCKFINDHWNDEIKLTKRNIKTILAQLDELDENQNLF